MLISLRRFIRPPFPEMIPRIKHIPFWCCLTAGDLLTCPAKPSRVWLSRFYFYKILLSIVKWQSTLTKSVTDWRESILSVECMQPGSFDFGRPIHGPHNVGIRHPHISDIPPFTKNRALTAKRLDGHRWKGWIGAMCHFSLPFPLPILSVCEGGGNNKLVFSSWLFCHSARFFFWCYCITWSSNIVLSLSSLRWRNSPYFRIRSWYPWWCLPSHYSQRAFPGVHSLWVLSDGRWWPAIPGRTSSHVIIFDYDK